MLTSGLTLGPVAAQVPGQMLMAPINPPPPAVATAARPWSGAKLADGQPDVQGFYRPEKQGTYSFTSPRNGGEAEVRHYHELELAGKPVPVWPSRIIDPPDGQIPYQPWARARQKYIEAHIFLPVRPQFIDPQARCFPDGVIRDPLWTGFQVQQFPGYVLILYDQNHTYRVIALDGRPHPPQSIKLWMSDSRGHWDANTLIVDVANSNSKHRFTNIGDFASDQVHITERFAFLDDRTFNYNATVDDPSVYTRPWTVSAKFLPDHRNEPGWELWEQACHEGERNAADSFLGGKAQ
jgi:hypothetical protein